MNVIYLLGAVQAAFFVVLIATKKGRQLSDTILMLMLMGMGLHLLSYYALSEQWYSDPVLGIVVLLVPPLIYVHGPFLYLYTEFATRKETNWRWYHALHFIPFALSVLNYTWLYIFKAQGDVSYFMTAPSIAAWIGMTFYLLNIFMNPVYVVIVFFKLRKHKRRVLDNYSNLEDVSLNWLRILALGLGTVSVIVWLVHSAIGLGLLKRGYEVDSYIFTFITVYVFFIGYYGFRQGVIYRFDQEATDLKNDVTSKYERSRINESEAEEYLERVQAYMQDEQPWLQSKFSLDELAKGTGITSHKISQILNLQLKKNFFEYINDYRVDVVKKKFFDPDLEHLSILGIALDSGFSSKSSFNRIFKQRTGMTPSQYKVGHSD